MTIGPTVYEQEESISRKKQGEPQVGDAGRKMEWAAAYGTPEGNMWWMNAEDAG